jgi:3-deoxy-D-manno-octulosonate 8-phosphate phosphatase (KDO 8-P phosphatase)
VLSDVDGVLTNGSLYIGSDGTEYKQFHVEDHSGIALLKFADISVGLLSARFSESTSIRAKEMGIITCIQGALNKAKELKEICGSNNISEKNIAYIGDGMIDIPVMERVGLSIAVNNADDFVKSKSDLVTLKDGGEGVLKEVAKFILIGQNKYDLAFSKMRNRVYES